MMLTHSLPAAASCYVRGFWGSITSTLSDLQRQRLIILPTVHVQFPFVSAVEFTCYDLKCATVGENFQKFTEHPHVRIHKVTLMTKRRCVCHLECHSSNCIWFANTSRIWPQRQSNQTINLKESFFSPVLHSIKGYIFK